MLLHDPGQADSLLHNWPRHCPAPMKTSALSGLRPSSEIGTQLNRRQRCAALAEHNASTFGSWPHSKVILPRKTPASSSASATDRNDDPLSPGPSSTMRNTAPEATPHCIT